MSGVNRPGRGPTPGEYTVTFSEAGVATVEGPRVRRETAVSLSVDDLEISLAFGTTLPSHLADLVDVAVAVYVADRLCARRARSAEPSDADELWQRRMLIRLPLRNSAAWSPERRRRVESLLGFLTDDDWTLEFTQERPKLRPSEAQGSLFPDIPTGDVTSGLLSGGLDSLAGLTTELAACPSRTVIAFSARTNRRIGAYQRIQIRQLTSRFGPRVLHVPATIRLKDRTRGAYDREEPSQRTRGFVFQVFGAVTAAVAGVDSLHVYENGVGALNLPYSASQLGAQATRATNPITIAVASELLGEIVGREFRVRLPHQFTTKAELCSVFRDPHLRDLIALTISCDNFPQRIAGKPQCGVCPSCLLSRQSLFSAGLRDADPSDRFRHDVYRLHGSSWVEHGYHLRVMTTQAAALAAAIHTENPWHALVRQYPILLEIAQRVCSTPASEPSSAIPSLLGRYSNDWLEFWKAVRPHAAAPA